ncbi:MAG: ParB/RepB/Spo0J family partition protein [Actinobacteria bacterium]|nr:ParB/RepB/Spo0J family partition protein [Actinomycetota bacterium]
MASATPKRGLGKGLGALIPGSLAGGPGAAATDDPAEPVSEVGVGAVYAELPIGSVAPNPRQPREIFDEDALSELVFSIREIGLLQPIVVRQSAPGAYELVAGERRLRASREAGLTHIPAIIRHTDDDAMLRDALLENLHRANLNPLEEAAAYQQLLSDFGCTQDELARRIGRSRPQVTNTLRLLKLPPDVQRRVAAGVLSAGHARALLSLDDASAMDALATRIVAEGLSVRAVEEIVIVGDGDGRKRRSSPRARVSLPRDAEIDAVVAELIARIADRLDTRAAADGFATRKSRGRILVECADIEDLRRISDAISGR